MPDIYVDADACPVKDEVMRVANRHGLTVHMVGNTWMRLNNEVGVNRVVVPEGPDAADDWIAEHIAANDIAITADIELASRCLGSGAHVLGPTGDAFTDDNIGSALAMRDLKKHLRETGEISGYNRGFTGKDRSNFLDMLERTVQSTKRTP